MSTGEKKLFKIMFLICSRFLTTKPRVWGREWLKALMDCPLKKNFFAASLRRHGVGLGGVDETDYVSDEQYEINVSSVRR